MARVCEKVSYEESPHFFFTFADIIHRSWCYVDTLPKDRDFINCDSVKIDFCFSDPNSQFSTLLTLDGLNDLKIILFRLFVVEIIRKVDCLFFSIMGSICKNRKRNGRLFTTHSILFFWHIAIILPGVEAAGQVLLHPCRDVGNLLSNNVIRT